MDGLGCLHGNTKFSYHENPNSSSGTALLSCDFNLVSAILSRDVCSRSITSLSLSTYVASKKLFSSQKSLHEGQKVDGIEMKVIE